MKFKKTQVAMEFLIVFVFIMIALSFVLFLIGSASVEVSEDQNKKRIDDFAQRIISEFELAQEVPEGYVRQFVIESHFQDRYNVSFNESYLIIEDIDVYGEDGDSFVYVLPGIFNLTTSVDVDGNYVVTLTKLESDFGNRLTIQPPGKNCRNHLDPTSLFQGGSGTVVDPYRVCNCSQLQDIGFDATTLSSHYILTNNVDCSISRTWDPFGPGFGFKSIGRDPAIEFTGSLDGLGHQINNLYIHDYGGIGASLIARLKGNVSNFGVVNANITNGGPGTGIAVGWAESGSNISNLYSTGIIELGGTATGGLIGFATGANVENSYSTAVILDSFITVGGLVGRITYSVINNSFATGNVSGASDVGGLIGEAYNLVIDNSYTSNFVNGSWHVGGLIGHADATDISNSYSTGFVTGEIRVGGVVGLSQNGGTLRGVYSSATVNGSNEVGGFVGKHEEEFGGRIADSFAVGNVTSIGNNEGGFSGNYTFEVVQFSVNNYWNNYSENSRNSNGTSAEPFFGVTVIDDNEPYFYTNANPPMDTWRTDRWVFSGADLPRLHWE